MPKDPDLTHAWKVVHTFDGPVYAEMAEAAVREAGIPCLLKKNFFNSAYGVQGTDGMGLRSQLLVPADREEEARDLIAGMTSDFSE